MDRHELDLTDKSKLRLKRSHEDSSSNSAGKMNLDNGSKSDSKDHEEDSLADFKSPKQQTRDKPILDKFKAKTKKRLATSKVKSRKSDANQPSIEASLLKPQACNQDKTDLKEAVPCPLCLKPFKDDSTCTGHMKSCAAKNNVSIKQLLEAKRLQDRQAQERKAIGLLAAPIIPEKKKTFRNRNFSTADDPQLQLVLAMSESLYEAEKMVELEEAAFLAGIPSEYITEMNEEERKKTLQNFGFTTNKPRADIATNKQRRKKLFGPTILQTRSKEDKDRVLTERIACILTGEDALTQAPEKTRTSLEPKPPTSITSRLLEKIEKKENKLWDQGRLTKRFHDFYVNELKAHFFQPTEQQQPVESAIHGWLEQENQDTQTLNSSLVYEPMDPDVIINNQEFEGDTSRHCETLGMNAPERNNYESEFVQNFINGWKEALNDSSACDLVVLVKENRRIYAHKLVLHVHCPNMLLDVEPLEAGLDSRIGQKISWLDKEKDSALAFLEFVYSGTIHKYASIFYHEKLVDQVEQLARLYRKKEVFDYIREKRVQFQEESLKKLERFDCMQDREILNQSVRKTEAGEDEPVSKSLVSNTEELIDRRITASPDLFDSEEDEADNHHMKEENVQDSDESDHLNSQKTLVNLSRSVSPVDDKFHEAVTPPSGRSPRGYGESFDDQEEEFAQAVTPKRQSPEKTLDIKQEALESLANAVTPEYVTELSDHADVAVTAHIDESIHTAVTPPRLADQSIDKKVRKGELTMFIEKVQRRNAKDIMDTDSETDSPNNRVRPRNPFLKRDQDDSYKYLRNNKIPEEPKAISLLERDVLDEQEAQKHLKIHFNESTQDDLERPKKPDKPRTSKLEQVASANDSNLKEEVSLSDDDVQDVTMNETEMSMYTRYKKSNKCDESIGFYRRQLGLDKARSGTNAEEDRTVPQSARVKKPKPRIIEDVTLVSDSDEEESPLRTFLRDKSKKKIHRTEPDSKVIDLSLDSDDVAIQNNNKSMLQAEKMSEDIDAEISKILQSSQESHVHENWKCDQAEVISLASSQDSESSLALGENGDLDVLAFNDWDLDPSPPREAARSASASSNRAEPCDQLKTLSNSKGDSKNCSYKMTDDAESTRKLKVKSASTSNLTGKLGETDRSSLIRPFSSFVTPEQNNKPSSDQDTTPPTDYSLLDTPNLQKRLKKFGLKPQNRARAKALLTHIYKETHSQPSASQKRSSSTEEEDDDEPPRKRQYLTETRAAENGEMDLDEPDVAEQPVSIKDAFTRLIKTNRDLYQKVLTYEPLALESLQFMLKQDGFKCQLDSLMNFLDEQCITFQVKDKKADRIKK